MDFKVVTCGLPFVVKPPKNKNVNFEGNLGYVFNSIFPKKKLNLTLHPTTNCVLGSRLSNGSYDGLYGDLADNNLDFAIFFAKQQALNEDFLYSVALTFEKILFYYFFKVKFNKTSILSNIKKISSLIFFFLILAILIDFIFKLMKKKVAHKTHQLLITIFVSFFLSNYILGSLNVLLIEIDKSDFMKTIEDLSHNLNYEPKIDRGALEDFFTENDDKVKKEICIRIKNSKTVHPSSCKQAESLTSLLECIQHAQKKNLAVIIEDRSLKVYEPIYCSDTFQSTAQKESILIISEPFSSILNFFPYHKNINFDKRKYLDNYYSFIFSLGIFLKFDVDLKIYIRKALFTSKLDCIAEKRKEFIDNNFFFSQLAFKNYESLFLILICFQTLFFILFLTKKN